MEFTRKELEVIKDALEDKLLYLKKQIKKSKFELVIAKEDIQHITNALQKIE